MLTSGGKNGKLKESQGVPMQHKLKPEEEMSLEQCHITNIQVPAGTVAKGEFITVENAGKNKFDAFVVAVHPTPQSGKSDDCIIIRDTPSARRVFGVFQDVARLEQLGAISSGK
jgi:hypothetical protein